nr:nicotinate-nucleotide--dimethylbenzimidazole phosphoribosyltransferase [Desulfurivibrio alkaliphilus]
MWVANRPKKTFPSAALCGEILEAARSRVPVVDGFISSAAALAMGLVEAGLKIMHEMATFGEAGVSQG